MFGNLVVFNSIKVVKIYSETLVCRKASVNHRLPTEGSG